MLPRKERPELGELAPEAALIADPVVLALAAALCFGLALVTTQFGLTHMAPGHGAVVSISTSAALLWLASPALMDWRGFAPQPAAIFAGVGLLFPAAVTLLTFEANRRMGPNVAGALGNLAPLFAILLALVLFGEVPSLRQVAGIVAVLVGIVALSVERRWLEVRWSPWVMALPVGAAAIRGIVQPIAKFGLATWPSPFAAALIGYTVSAVVVAGAALRRAQGGRGFDRRGALWFGCVGLCNGCAVLALYAALARGSVTLVSPLVATYPIVTLVLAALLLRGPPLDARLIAGVMLTVMGAAILITGR